MISCPDINNVRDRPFIGPVFVRGRIVYYAAVEIHGGRAPAVKIVGDGAAKGLHYIRQLIEA